MGQILSHQTLSKRTARAYVTDPSKAPTFWMIGIAWRVLATGVQTGGSFCLLDQLCPPESGPTRHEHPQDEGLYVVSGSVAFQAGGVELTAGPGSFVAVPRHTEHSFVVQEDSRLVNFYLPAGFEMWLMGSALPAEANTLPPPGGPAPARPLTEILSGDYGGLPLTQERSTSANPDAIARPTHLRAADADGYWYAGGLWAILASGASTGGSYCMFEVTMPQGAGLLPHLRDAADQVFYVLQGEVEVLLDDRVETAGAGALVFSPHATLTALRVVSAQARFLLTNTVPGFERLVEAFGDRAPAARLPAADWQTPTVSEKRARDLYADIGLRPLPSLTWSSAGKHIQASG